jgi:5-methylcytosine-specific restriction endonuclease McrA
MPHEILNWMDAICLVYLGKVDIKEEYSEIVESPSTSYFIPAVMQLRRAFSPVKKGVKFSKTNVFSRDGFRCCYCGERKNINELNMDHVLPRKQGGQTTWNNIVTSCFPCNERKGCRTPEQAGMPLLRKPARPHSLPLHTVFVDSRNIPEVWKPYLETVRLQPHGSGFYLVGCSAA